MHAVIIWVGIKLKSSNYTFVKKGKYVRMRIRDPNRGKHIIALQILNGILQLGSGNLIKKIDRI